MKQKTNRFIALVLCVIILASGLAMGAIALTDSPTAPEDIIELSSDTATVTEASGVAGALGTAVNVFRCVEYAGRTIKTIDAVIKSIKNNDSFKETFYAAVDAFTNKANVTVAPSSPNTEFHQKLHDEIIAEIESINEKIGDMDQDLADIKTSINDLATVVTDEFDKAYINDFAKSYVDNADRLMENYKLLMNSLDISGSDIETARINYDALYNAADALEKELYNYMTGVYRLATDKKPIQDVLYSHKTNAGTVDAANEACIKFTENLFATYALSQYSLLVSRMYQLEYCAHNGTEQYRMTDSTMSFPVKSITESIKAMDGRYETIAAQVGKYITEKNNYTIQMIYVPASRPEQYSVTSEEIKYTLYFGDSYYCTPSLSDKYLYIFAGEKLTFETSDETVAKITGERELQILDNRDFDLKLKYRDNVLYTYSFTVKDRVLCGGYGTYKTPYLLGTADDLIAASKLTSAANYSFKLISNIAFSGDYAFPSYVFEKYNATFDGNGYVVSGVKITENSQTTGFFGTLNGAVKDLTLQQAQIIVNPGYSTNAPHHIGTLAGRNYGQIYNCAVENSTVNTRNNTQTSTTPYRKDIGGIVGYNTGFVEHCQSRGFAFYNTVKTFYGFVTNMPYTICVGGLAGESSGTLKNNLVNEAQIRISGLTAAELCFYDMEIPSSLSDSYLSSILRVSCGYVIGNRDATKDEAIYYGGVLNNSAVAQIGNSKYPLKSRNYSGIVSSTLSSEELAEYGAMSPTTLNRNVYNGIVASKAPITTQIPYGEDIRLWGMHISLLNKSSRIPSSIVPITSISGFDKNKLGKQTVTLSYKPGFVGALSTTFEIEVVCDHEFDKWTKIDDVSHSRTCVCGVTETVEHEWDEGKVVSTPSCTVNGEVVFTCATCEGTRTEITEAVGHVFGEWTETAAPSCTEPGSERRDCTVCNGYQSRAIDALGHVSVPVEGYGATCTETGRTNGAKCTRCNNTLTPQFIIPAKGHDMVSRDGKNSTCYEIGWTPYQICQREGCRYKENYNEIPKIPHTITTWTTINEPTCEEKGLERGECSVLLCGHVEHRQTDALGHDEIPHEAKPHTCTEVGWEAYVTCSRCSYTTYTEIPASHTLGNWTYTAEPKCETDGEERRDCNACEYFETRKASALGHDKTQHAAKPNSCTEIGWDAYESCSRCSYTTYVEIPASHTFGSWAQTKPPKCEEKGEERRDCNACEHFETRGIAATGHTSVTDVAVSPTCTGTGLTAGSHCSVCNKIITPQTTVNALGHVETSHLAKAPTCVEPGWEAYVDCSRCTYTTYVQIPANGHSYADWIQTLAPECEAPGSERRNCKNCTHYETRKIAALGHDEIFHAAKAPTCNEFGWKEYVSCANCDYSTYVRLPKAHSFDVWTQTIAPTCNTAGEERRDCNECDQFEVREVAKLAHTDADGNGKCDVCNYTPSTNETVNPTPNGTDDKKNELSSGAVAAIAAGSVATGAGGVALTVVAVKKRWFAGLLKIFKR